MKEKVVQKESVAVWLILAGLMAFTSLSTDIYLPAMPQMQADLNGDIELTITAFLIGFAFGQIFWGPVSDRYGRKIPLTIGLIIFVIGSIGCALSETIFQIIVFRVLQAFGACVGPMLSRAIVRDTHERTKAAEMLSTLMILMALAPIIAPLIGGQLIKFSTWHSSFWLLASIGAIMLFALVKLPESLPAEKRVSSSLWEAFKKYWILLNNRVFMAYTLSVTFYYVGAYAFIAGSPLIYISYYGVDPEYFGWLFAINMIGLIIISVANRKLVNKYSLDTLLKISTLVAMLSGLLLMVLVYFKIGGIYGIIIPVFIFFATNGIIAACTTAAALDKVPEMAGAASALLGSLQYGSGILSTILLAWFGNGEGNPWTMSWIIGVFAVASFLMVIIRKFIRV